MECWSVECRAAVQYVRTVAEFVVVGGPVKRVCYSGRTGQNGWLKGFARVNFSLFFR